MKKQKAKNVEALYPVAPLQQGMIFHHLLEPNSGAYMVQFTCHFEGPFQLEAFRRTWERIIERHAVFRTGFVGGRSQEYAQVVFRKVVMPFEVLDWRGLAEAEWSVRLETFREQDRLRDFQLAKPPLTRFTVIQLSEQNHFFIWMTHHLIMDGWSLPLVMREAFALYEHERRGLPLELPRPRPYRDFIAWLQKQDRTAAEQFWTQTLAGVRSKTPLPMGHVHDYRLSEGVERFTDDKVFLDEPTTVALHAFARSEKMTVNTLIQGAWALLLANQAGSADVIYGTTVSGRPPRIGWR